MQTLLIAFLAIGALVITGSVVFAAFNGARQAGREGDRQGRLILIGFGVVILLAFISGLFR